MIVVYGVAHCGKANRVDRYDNCEHCGVFGKLSSYDAVAFFTIYWIPFIPLGRKHVVDHCPSCKKHREISLRKYRKIKEKELGEAVANMKNSPDDADKAIEGIHAFIRHNEFTSFETMATALGRKHAGNAKVMNALGAAYEYMGRLDSAEACFRQAVNNANTPENVVDLVRVLLLQHKIAEAEPHFDPIFAGQQPKNVGLIYLLVEAYREQGQHARALKALETIEKLDPRLAKDDEHAELVKTSTAALESGEAIPSAVLNRPRGLQTSKGTSPLLPTLVLPGIVLAVLAMYLVACFNKGVSCPMWLVNGTGVEYTVDIHGKAYKLGPHAGRLVRLPQGEIPMAIEGPFLRVPPSTVSVRTPFFSRAFSDTSIVLNPDAQAVLVRERNTYSAQSVREEDPVYTLHSGKELHIFEDIDYEFTDFPSSITTESSASRIHKWRVYNIVPEEGMSMFQLALQGLEERHLIVGYLRKRALMHPDDITALTLYCTVAMSDPNEDALPLLKQGTSRRPLLVDWHRLYQSIMEQSSPDHDLVSEYRAMQEAEPRNRELMYLLGRVLEDRAEATKWFEKAEGGPRPIGFGYASMSFNHYCLGEFAEAAALLEKAMAIKPDREPWRDQYRTILLGAKRYDDLLAAIRKSRKAEPTEGLHVANEVNVLTQAGRIAEAQQAMAAYLALMKEQEPGAVPDLKRALKGSIAYASGNFAVYRECYAGSRSPNDLFALALIDEDTNAIEAALEKVEGPTYFQYLLAYCRLVQKGHTERAGKQLAKAIESLENTAPEYRRTARMLKGDAALVREQLAPMHMESYDKRLIATAIGLAVPEVRDHCFAIARRHNFDHTFPYQTLAAILK